MRKLLIYLGLLTLHVVMVFLVHITGKTFYTKKMDSKTLHPEVFDIGEQFLPDLHDKWWLKYAIDIIAAFLPLAFGIEIAIEQAQFMLVILLIRHVFTLVTILPKHKKCDDTSFGIRELAFGHCYDKIFSGHFSAVFLLSLILYKHGLLSIPLAIVALVTYACILISVRYHYTVDILVAIVVTLLIYKNNWKLRIN